MAAQTTVGVGAEVVAEIAADHLTLDGHAKNCEDAANKFFKSIMQSSNLIEGDEVDRTRLRYHYAYNLYYLMQQQIEKADNKEAFARSLCAFVIKNDQKQSYMSKDVEHTFTDLFLKSGIKYTKNGQTIALGCVPIKTKNGKRKIEDKYVTDIDTYHSLCFANEAAADVFRICKEAYLKRLLNDDDNIEVRWFKI